MSDSDNRTLAISRARNSVSAWVRSATSRSLSAVDPVAAFLTVLGEQDQRCRVGRLQRQHERQQHEAAAPRVELRTASGANDVVRRSRR